MKEEDLKLGKTYLNTAKDARDVIDRLTTGERVIIVCGDKSISFNRRDVGEEEIREANKKAVDKILNILCEYEDKFKNLFEEL